MTGLCRLTDLTDPGARGFVIERDGKKVSVVVARRGRKVYGWINSCPHLWVPLDIEPDQFLNLSGEFLLCANHGALFDMTNGLCVLGPCRNKSLQPFPVKVVDGMVTIAQ